MNKKVYKIVMAFVILVVTAGVYGGVTAMVCRWLPADSPVGEWVRAVLLMLSVIFYMFLYRRFCRRLADAGKSKE